MRANHSSLNQSHNSSGSNRSGVHVLRDRAVLNALLASADLNVGDVVVEFGAGTGAITAELAKRHTRVVAVERSAKLVGVLRRRFADHRDVTIVHDDARSVPLPHRPFAVVANPPFSISTAVLRRLLAPRTTQLRSADLLLEWGFAKRLTATSPRDFEMAWWRARFDIAIARKVGPRSFAPSPGVNSAHVTIRRKAMSRADEWLAWHDLRAWYGVSGREARRYARARPTP